jgi:acetoacetate decarboxylase
LRCEVPGASNRSAVVEIIIPARYRDTVGGFYAFCYIDTDDALALGREPFGYPKSYARSHMQKTGRAVTAAMKRKDAAVEVSVILGSGIASVAEVPLYPHLLLQTFPSAETTEPRQATLALRGAHLR